MIPFNKPYLTGNETLYINKAAESGKISGNGEFTKKCQRYFQDRFGFKKALLTTSCTDALEMCAILLDIQPGDEVIIPSYTFVSTANAFILRGAKIVFADSLADHPNINHTDIESLITKKTKAIVVVHYAGVACEMDYITEIAKRHQIAVVEDAAQAIDSYYKGKPLGAFGDLAAFSFHETKNIISGEGGLLVINNEKYEARSEIIWEKGTNRSAFFRGEANKYGWVDIGSSFLPSEVIAAFLFAQLENLEMIQKQRMHVWKRYYDAFKTLENEGLVKLPIIPEFATNNAHMFYLVLNNEINRDYILKNLKENGILAVFHYLALHDSDYYKQKHDGRLLKNSIKFTNSLIRLPLFYELTDKDIDYIVDNFYKITRNIAK